MGLFLMVVIVLLTWAAKINAQLPPAKDIFILAGQSNMMGVGGVLYDQNKQAYWDGIVPPDNAPDPYRVFRLAANLTWEVAHDPLHIDIDVGYAIGVGPGMSFANAIKEYSFLPIGLVPCAKPGTTIRQWARGKEFYENMLNRSRVAAASGEIKALLWYQGESDTQIDEQVNSYEDNMVNFILNVRADLDLPSLPIIQVAIATGFNMERVNKIREIQKSMIKLPKVVCVDALGLEINEEDHMHLTTPSQVILGHMLAGNISTLIY